jgi:hypothetical protein
MDFSKKDTSENIGELAIKKFWGKMAEMITGPEHEAVYLHALCDKIKAYKNKL